MSDQVTTSERLWSEEVGMAEADALPRKEIAYEWSNGRTFEDGNGLYQQEGQ